MQSRKQEHITVNQCKALLGCTDENVRVAIRKGLLTVVYPYPHALGSGTETGQMFIKCDEKLEHYLLINTQAARTRKHSRTYEPLTELKKYCAIAKQDDRTVPITDGGAANLLGDGWN